MVEVVEFVRFPTIFPTLLLVCPDPEDTPSKYRKITSYRYSIGEHLHQLFPTTVSCPTPKPKPQSNNINIQLSSTNTPTASTPLFDPSPDDGGLGSLHKQSPVGSSPAAAPPPLPTPQNHRTGHRTDDVIVRDMAIEEEEEEEAEEVAEGVISDVEVEVGDELSVDADDLSSSESVCPQNESPFFRVGALLALKLILISPPPPTPPPHSQHPQRPPILSHQTKILIFQTFSTLNKLHTLYLIVDHVSDLLMRDMNNEYRIDWREG